MTNTSDDHGTGPTAATISQPREPQHYRAQRLGS